MGKYKLDLAYSNGAQAFSVLQPRKNGAGEIYHFKLRSKG